MSTVHSTVQTTLDHIVSANQHLLDDIDLPLLVHDALSWLQIPVARSRSCFDVLRFPMLDIPVHFRYRPLALYLCCYSVLAVLTPLLYLVSYRRRRRGSKDPDSPRLRAPLAALLSFLTPTSSSWPELYLSIARDGLSNTSSTLKVPLCRLLDDVISGAVELRFAAVDLPPFISNTLRPRGWTIIPCVETSWYACVAFRTVCLRLASWVPSGYYRLGGRIYAPWWSQDYFAKVPLSPATDPGASPMKLASITLPPGNLVAPTPSDLPQRDFPSGMAMLSLDAVPFSKLGAYIRALQLSLPPGTSAIVGFSTRSNSVSYMSTAFLQASIPFLARKHVTESQAKSISQPGKSTAGRCPSLAMKPTPLLTSLDYNLKLLTSGAAPMLVESVQNVSAQYADHLDRYVQELTDVPNVRDRFAAQWGMAGWREERALVAWEAALFRAGLMSRWAIFVTRRGQSQ